MKASRKNTWIVAVLLPTLSATAGVYPDTPTRLWPNGIVPYKFDDDPSITLDQRLVVLSAMGAWSEAANVTFVFQNDIEGDRLLFIRQATTGPFYAPPEGYGAGTGAHILDLSFWGTNDNAVGMCKTVFGMAHEIGHALGLLHTHQSPARDVYFSVRTNLVTSGREGNYDIDPNALQWPRSIPDIDSIMSYPLCVFTVCSNCLTNITACAPILLREPWATEWANNLTCGDECPPPVQCVGQRNHLSVWDKALMSYLYPQPDWRFAEAASTQEAEDGSFHYPAKTFLLGKSLVPQNGTLFMEPSTYSNSDGVHSKPMTIRATRQGSVFLR